MPVQKGLSVWLSVNTVLQGITDFQDKVTSKPLSEVSTSIRATRNYI
jgi:hypothetical protein